MTLNTMTAMRTPENLKLPIAAQLAVAPPPQGPARRLGKADLYTPMGIWAFAENSEGARQFLVDYVGTSRQTLLASQFYLFPT